MNIVITMYDTIYFIGAWITLKKHRQKQNNISPENFQKNHQGFDWGKQGE
jgi:hypothetical protein